MTTKETLEFIEKILIEKKAKDIEIFNLSDVDSYIASWAIRAISLNQIHTIALYDELLKELKKSGIKPINSDISDNWAIMDLGNMVVHIMTQECDDKYKIEEFFKELLSSNSI